MVANKEQDTVLRVGGMLVTSRINRRVLSQISGNGQSKNGARQKTIAEYSAQPDKKQLVAQPSPTTSTSEDSSKTPNAARKRSTDVAAASVVKKYRRASTLDVAPPTQPSSAAGGMTDIGGVDDDDDDAICVVEDDNWSESLNFVKEPIYQGNGLIRIGPQPVDAHTYNIRSAPRVYADMIIWRSVQKNGQRTDEKISGATRASVIPELKAVANKFAAAMVYNINTDRVFYPCDYTGMNLAWTPGPESVSLEATYPFSSTAEDATLYHSVPNTVLVSTSLNMMKCTFPIAILPAMGILARVPQMQDPGLAKSTIAWATNSGLAVDEKRSILEAQRSVKLTPEMEAKLAVQDIDDLFRVTRSGSRRHSSMAARVATSERWAPRYQVIINLAAVHGLTREDFEHFLTIPTSRPGERVFYPFHVTSRPQAEARSWDWFDIETVAHGMLKTMLTHCNKYAEEKGLGEKDMTPEILVFWMVAHFCRVITRIRNCHPEWTRHDLLWFHTDRHHRPIVPWMYHPLRASLCKGPDHGIAMKFGITEGIPLARFDPIAHIDLNRSTITIDTTTTNALMYRYQPSAWPGILQHVALLPLHHPLWRIDEEAGRSVWGGTADRHSDVAPVMPSPGFTIGPLLPIDAWFAEEPLEPRCEVCDTSFGSFGALVQHCRAEHPIGHGLAQHVPEDTASRDSAEAKYWSITLQCSEPGCDNKKTYKSKYELRDHKRIHAGGDIPCDWPQCGKRFPHPELLSAHVKTHQDGWERQCPECDPRFRCP
ncbi:hypothetical protein PWT90_03755 [Aphanocladium album]|nr:hypothetical protein PWT90_03755 [Aphanocladium album]